MAIPRGKSASSSPSTSSPADNPSVNSSTGADTDKTSKAVVDKVMAKAEQLEPVSAPPPTLLQQPATDGVLSSPIPSPMPHPAVTIPSSAVTSVPVSDDDLPSILRRLTPIQRAKLRSAAISEGVIQGGVGGGRENSDGSLSVTIRVDGDLVPQLKTWAEEAGLPVQDQVRQIVDMLLNSYLLSPWEPPQPIGAPTAAGTAAASGAPAAAK